MLIKFEYIVNWRLTVEQSVKEKLLINPDLISHAMPYIKMLQNGENVLTQVHLSGYTFTSPIPFNEFSNWLEQQTKKIPKNLKIDEGGNI